MTTRINVLGVGISATEPQGVVELMVDWIESRQARYICVCAVHLVMECQGDPALREMVNRASLTVPDGMPLVWLARLSGWHHVRRVYGPDLMLSFCERASAKGYRTYLLGGAPGQPEVLAQKLRTRFQGLEVVGAWATPTRPLSPAENDRVISEINRAKPDIVWVGMGTNAQERWMAENRDRLDAPILIGVGAAFDFHSHKIRQAPAKMQRLGLEWLFRLLQEPRRLWRRYLVGNPVFIAKVLAQRVGLRHYELPEPKHPMQCPIQDDGPVPLSRQPADFLVMPDSVSDTTLEIGDAL